MGKWNNDCDRSLLYEITQNTFELSADKPFGQTKVVQLAVKNAVHIQCDRAYPGHLHGWVSRSKAGIQPAAWGWKWSDGVTSVLATGLTVAEMLCPALSLQLSNTLLIWRGIWEEQWEWLGDQKTHLFDERVVSPVYLTYHPGGQGFAWSHSLLKTGMWWQRALWSSRQTDNNTQLLQPKPKQIQSRNEG